jgi:hypothetical protein
MKIDTDAIDETARALVYLTLHDRFRACTDFVLGRAEPVLRKGLYLRPGQQDEIGAPYRRRATRV